MHARQVTMQWCVHVDVAVSTWSLDAVVAPHVKENCCKRELPEDGNNIGGSSPGPSASATADSVPPAARIAQHYIETHCGTGKAGAVTYRAAVLALIDEVQGYIPYIQVRCIHMRRRLLMQLFCWYVLTLLYHHPLAP